MQRLDLLPAIFDLSGWHILIILFVALLLFGRRLPEIMRGMGSSVKEFKKGMNEDPAAPSTPAAPLPTSTQAPPPATPQTPAGSIPRDMSAAQQPPKV